MIKLGDAKMFGMLFGLIGVLAMVWVIYEIVTKQRSMNSTHKLIWILCAVFFNIITAIVYYFVVKKK